MIKPVNFECPVCCTGSRKQQAYSIRNCSHLFCRDCCLSHIDQRLNTFEQIKCLQTNCSQKLTKQSIIYQILNQQTKKKFLKYQQFIRLQQNRNLRACLNQKCLGLIDTKKAIQLPEKHTFCLQCNECTQKYCTKCYNRFHSSDEPCKLQNQQQRIKQQKTMRALNYRRCPACNVWVEKNGGCQYLVCKCKTEFCFNCGSNFDNDPCRKFHLQESERSIRTKSKFKNFVRKPKSFIGYLCLLPLTLLKLLLLIVFTIMSGVVFMLIVFGVLVPLIYLVAPAGLIIGLGQMQLNQKYVLPLRILTVLFYPIIGLVVAVGVFFIFVSYPILRNIISSHLFDQIDRFINQVSLVYLGSFNCIKEM